MLRPLYLAGSAYIAVCALAIARSPLVRGDPAATAVTTVAPVTVAADPRNGAAAWFAAAKPFCNSVEVESWTAHSPPPGGVDGAGYGAACLALAGKIERARAAIETLPPGERAAAAGIVFSLGHPVADAGDDASAGPIMRLVVEYQPGNYMALYHAGISEYALGHADVARDLLRRFVRIYTQEDGWRSNARAVLERLGEER